MFQAISVKLANIKPVEDKWSKEAIEEVKKYVKNRDVLHMVIVEPSDTLKVLLFEVFPTVNMCINAIMVKNNMAESTGKM